MRRRGGDRSTPTPVAVPDPSARPAGVGRLGSGARKRRAGPARGITWWKGGRKRTGRARSFRDLEGEGECGEGRPGPERHDRGKPESGLDPVPESGDCVGAPDKRTTPPPAPRPFCLSRPRASKPHPRRPPTFLHASHRSRACFGRGLGAVGSHWGPGGATRRPEGPERRLVRRGGPPACSPEAPAGPVTRGARGVRLGRRPGLPRSLSRRPPPRSESVPRVSRSDSS